MRSGGYADLTSDKSGILYPRAEAFELRPDGRTVGVDELFAEL
jgi:hypothetical protein